MIESSLDIIKDTLRENKITSEDGTVSFEICKFIKKYIYPIDVLIYNDYFELFNSLQNEQTDMVFVNEDLLLKSIEL